MNQQILQWFEQYPNQFHSGQALSRQLGCSRSAVWKHIQSLRKEGYVFEAVPHRGYKLQSVPHRFNLMKLINQLNTKVIGRKIHFFDKVDSTQTKAHVFISQGALEGEIIIAETQTAGKGRMGRQWHSPPYKGIWMSVILTPQIPVMDIPQLSLVVSVAICRAIRRICDLDVGIKWPNDLLIHNKKICGILLESSGEDERLRYVIVGIGISVNLQLADYPQALHSIATSLAMESRRDVDREQLLQACLEEMEELYVLFIEKGFAPIRTLWEALSVSLHRPIRVQQGLEMIEGIAESLDASGGLIMKKHSGERIIVNSGMIEHD